MSQHPSPIPQVGVQLGRGPSGALSTFFPLPSPFPGCVRPQGVVGRWPRDRYRVADAHTGRGDGEPPPLRSESWKGWEGEGSWAPGQAILETKRSWREGHGQGHLELLGWGLLSTLDCLGKGRGRKGLAGLTKPEIFFLATPRHHQPLHIPSAWPWISRSSSQLSSALYPLGPAGGAGLSSSDLKGMGNGVGDTLCGSVAQVRTYINMENSNVLKHVCRYVSASLQMPLRTPFPIAPHVGELTFTPQHSQWRAAHARILGSCLGMSVHTRLPACPSTRMRLLAHLCAGVVVVV